MGFFPATLPEYRCFQPPLTGIAFRQRQADEQISLKAARSGAFPANAANRAKSEDHSAQKDAEWFY
jgi:hypothetical protein